MESIFSSRVPTPTMFPFGTKSDGRTTMCTWRVEQSGSFKHSLNPSTISKLIWSNTDLCMWNHKHINLSLVPKVHEEQTSEAACSSEPPLRHCGYTRNVRLGPEWLASTIQLFCDITTNCVHSVSRLQGYRNMHTVCRSWVVGLTFRHRASSV